MRPALALLLLLVPFSLSAASADLRVRIAGARQLAQGERATYRAIVENRGPDAAEDVLLHLRSSPEYGCAASMTIGTLAAGASHSLQCEVTVPTGALDSWLVLVHATATSGTPDPHQGDEMASQFVDIVTPFPDLVVSAFVTREAAVPALPVPVRVFYINMARVTSRGATITIRSADGFGSVPSFCTAAGDRATCAVGEIEPETAGFISGESFDLEVIAPDSSDASFDVDVLIEALDGGDADPSDNARTSTGRTYRTFFVSNTRDEGSGSLRAAIEQANASCFDETPCLIAFRIPPAGELWHTIRPESPLPWIGALRLEIDASLQAAYFGETNDAGPDVELSGELLDEGDGLIIASHCTSAVRGLAINGFPRLGLLLAAADCSLWPGEPHRIRREIVANHIGTDPTGAVARPNVRGIHIGGSGRWSVRENVISGNRVSGVFIESGINVVERNIIGLDRALTGPLSNGGSGVWIGRQASGSTVDFNMIGFNHHAGVAIDRDATAVSVYGNSLQANYHRAIDWGLDGAASGPILIPEITSVRVESGKTIVEGVTGATGGTFSPVVQVYANDAPDPSGYGEGQYFLGGVRANAGAFRFEYDGDLSGKWITATSTREDYSGWAKPPLVQTHSDTGWGFLTTTSEFSRAVEVP